MKHLQTYQQLNESMIDSNLKKEFAFTLKQMDEISNAILNAKDFKNRVKLMKKENPDIGKAMGDYKEYLDLATKVQKIVKQIRSKGLSSDRRKATKQLRAIQGFSGTLKTVFDNLNKFDKKTKKGFESNEGIATIIGNTLRNILTGQFIVNILKTIKGNLMDSQAELTTVQDVFDIKDY